MRLSHFETLKPVCPQCRVKHQQFNPLAISSISQQQDDIIIEGYLSCTNSQCNGEYPIIDGVPIIHNDVKQYINDNFYSITKRDDLTPVTESILGDAAGPSTEFNTIRHYMSLYGWTHYADKAPAGTFTSEKKNTAGNIAECLNAGLSLFDKKPQTPILDIGCAVGRSTFELAEKHAGLALGIDLNFSLLRAAQKVLREGVIRFPLKRIGVVYDQYEYEVSFNNMENADFWACNALALPFRNETFQFTSAFNVLDAVTMPRQLLISMSDVLQTGGQALLATPFDWIPSTPIDRWIGGHAQRGTHNGAAEPLLRELLSADKKPHIKNSLKLVGEIEDQAWNMRIHSRHTACYETHIVACQKV
jgi:ubiquinone/menaquinone biosynthesis C-methylase UbiE/uncharacterized protein YbaR (Trm112 family)